jgi:hypothetical protein
MAPTAMRQTLPRNIRTVSTPTPSFRTFFFNQNFKEGQPFEGTGKVLVQASTFGRTQRALAGVLS